MKDGIHLNESGLVIVVNNCLVYMFSLRFSGSKFLKN